MSDYAEVAATAADNLPPADGPGEAGAAAAPAPAAPDDAGVVPSSGEGAAPTWTGPSQEEWQSYQQRQAELEQQLAQAPAVPQFDPYTGQPLTGHQTPERPDPWDPDYAEKMEAFEDWRFEQKFNERFGAIQPFIEPVVSEYAQKEMTDSVARAAGAIGFDVNEVPQRADAIAAIASALLGTPGATTDTSYATGAQFVSELVKAEREAAVTAYKESLQRGNGQPEPGASGGGIPAPTAGDSYAAIAELYAADPDRPQRAFG